MREPHKHLSEFITDYLHTHNIGIPELSTQMDVAYTTVSAWSKGRALPSLEQFAALAVATNIDGGSLFLRVFPSARRDTANIEQEVAEYIGELSHEGQYLAKAMLTALAMKYSNEVKKD